MLPTVSLHSFIQLITCLVSQHDLGVVADAEALSGAFGSGAAFAFEDAYVLAAALQDAHTHGKTVASALAAYDEVRIPRYADLVCLRWA